MFGLGEIGKEGVRTLAKGVGGALMAGDKVKHVDIRPISIADITKETIAAQRSNLPGAEGLASSINLFNFEQIKKITEMASPGIFRTIANAGETIGQMVQGQIPKDVMDAIMNSSAAKAFGFGPNGGGASMQNGYEARKIGMTSLGIANQGIQQLATYLTGLNAFMPNTNVERFLPSIQQNIGIAQRNQELNYYNDIYDAKVAAAPDPLLASIGAALAESSGSMATMYGEVAHTLSTPAAQSGNWWNGGGSGSGSGVTAPGAGVNPPKSNWWDTGDASKWGGK